MASRARFDRSAFFRASKTMLNTVVPENTLCCGIYAQHIQLIERVDESLARGAREDCDTNGPAARVNGIVTRTRCGK